MEFNPKKSYQVGVYQDVEKVRQLCSRVAQRLNVRQRVRFASSLAAALVGESRVWARRGGRVRNNGLFDHPVGYADSARDFEEVRR
jgi:cob(I)alamin adenosyltransferase